MTTQQKKFFRITVGIGVALLIFYIIGYVWALSSEPFAYAKNQFATSNMVKQKIGEPKKFKLDFFGYAIRYEGPKGRAEFSLTATGSKASARIHVELETNLGVWRISGMRINDEPVPLPL